MPIIFNRYYSGRNMSFFFGEGMLMWLSIMVVHWFFKGNVIFRIDFFDCFRQALIVVIVFQLCLYFFDLYDLSKDTSIPDTVTRITQAFGFGCIILGVIYFVVPGLQIPITEFWAGYLVICLSIVAWRSAYYYVLRKRMFVQDIAIIGTGKLASDIAKEVQDKRDAIYRILAFIGPDRPDFNHLDAPVFAELGEFLATVNIKKIARIIVAPDDRRGTVPVQDLLRLKLQGVEIEQGIAFYEGAAGKILAEKLNPSTIFFSKGFDLSRLKRAIKRTIDLVVSALLLVMTAPIILISAIIIKLESAGPVFYLQERVGEHSLPFKVIKLRSMRQDAEKNGAVWASVNDQRVTRFGAFIRKARIDELPQLWNVIKGEMSLVGPRPERPVFVEELVKVIPYYNIRHTVKPGVTGWAQVCYPYGASTEDALRKLEYDLYYLKNISVALDLFILFRTVKTVLFQKGGR
ncbi:TIGR03013 family PEP-CTERM/XrtA system glycosyltransferase [Desulfoprunum benzoelyticum]|uniref:Sugar transferase (PEP-CTERM system associated) n=1 Tax=Desulfoprunum benzoelyticum TaxID=1506996 RepID=A0A840UUC1_9BACT|nr:TIGR03013 family XrtA/PEP-CTERM system glycosyltransferase [Desulfoprunum benzoelyticum]MBB5346994.1 sugar transferase (PEP-CTERM system associated) [Desulfoprunum benzoelyticum]MBM9531638.1 TIGR03013 family PEP-CTERM/XrtA system glycosyltransferase [Desulfoprunum benzoelyticum]